MFTSEQKILATIAHLGTLFGAPILAPLLIFLLSEDSFVKLQAKEALVFQGAMVILSVISIPLMFILIGFVLLSVVGALSVIAAIVATVKVWNDKDFSYPITGSWTRNL
ncbi:DUF4870 domain-containing protein [Orenia marismortui]|uniref:Tic20 family protein n=1 Tax=Orenia marismortui TaxID=46469 RepID=A0A4R8H0F1_9FIRM|nr:DUF4870 domain-containing protein [Orenia marismortui]TDX48448.1 hypothetical protein C7959_12717 [Orenia marismortui]